MDYQIRNVALAVQKIILNKGDGDRIRTTINSKGM